jgi:phosphate-selective porin
MDDQNQNQNPIVSDDDKQFDAEITATINTFDASIASLEKEWYELAKKSEDIKNQADQDIEAAVNASNEFEQQDKDKIEGDVLTILEAEAGQGE